MRFYQLNPKILRNHLASRQWYKCDDESNEHEGVVIGVSKTTPWALIEQSTEPLNKNDCTEITHDQYYERYDHADFIINHCQI